jgi:hypothetical protein
MVAYHGKAPLSALAALVYEHFGVHRGLGDPGPETVVEAVQQILDGR